LFRGGFGDFVPARPACIGLHNLRAHPSNPIRNLELAGFGREPRYGTGVTLPALPKLSQSGLVDLEGVCASQKDVTTGITLFFPVALSVTDIARTVCSPHQPKASHMRVFSH